MFMIALLLHSCTTSVNKSPATDSTARGIQDNSETNRTPRTFSGLYTFGNEVNTFQECKDPQKIYWVNDSLSLMRKAYEETSEFMSYPYESKYAVVKGYLSGRSKMGYASEYEDVLIITEILKLEPKNFRTSCYNYEFIALGNEPFWSLDIIPAEKRIVLKDAGMEKVHEFIYSPAIIGGGAHRYEVTNSKNEKLVVMLREEPCSDGMSDRNYKYSAEISLNGRILKGCAIKKGDTFKDRP